MNTNARAVKKTKLSYVFPIIFTFAMVLWSFAPLLPRLVKAVMPFPKLEGATYLVGTFDYEGEWPQVALPKYFVVDTQGRHEFQCGYFGSRQTCFSKPSTFKGQPIEVWTSFWFGRIQQKTVAPQGVRPHPMDELIEPYSASLFSYHDPRYTEVKGFSLFKPFVLLLFAGCLIVMEIWRRQELEEQRKKDQQNTPKTSKGNFK